MHVAIDTETYLIRPGVLAPKPVCASLMYEDGDAPFLLEPSNPNLVDIIAQDGHVIVGHNFAYDAAVLAAHVPGALEAILKAYDDNRVRDTMIAERTLDIADGRFSRNYSLGAFAARYLGMELDKGDDGWRLRYSELDGVPFDEWPERARAYALEDARTTLLVYEAQAERGRKSDYWPLPATEGNDVRAAFCLHLMSCRGFKVDVDAVERLKAKLEDDQYELSKTLYEMGYLKPKTVRDRRTIEAGNFALAEMSKDNKKLQALVEQHVPDVERTPTGRPKTGADVLARVPDPAAQALVSYTKNEKIISTYLVPMSRAVFQPRYNALGADSGRTSCGKARATNINGETEQVGSNIQNLPRLPGIRECFRARDGLVLVACDFNSQEMRTLAQSCIDLLGHSRLAEEYQKNPDFDPHQQLADEHGVSRQHAKVANFGLPGGMGPSGLMGYAKGYGLDLSYEDAEELKEAWLNHWPEMREYYDYVHSLPGIRDGIATVQHPRTGFVRGGAFYTSTCNFFFQHLAAAASKLALHQVTQEAYSARWLNTVYPLAFIHDEIIAEVLEGVAHEWAEEMVDTMEGAMSLLTPDVPVRAEAHLMRRWSKKAKDVRDESGRRIPWEDVGWPSSL